MRMQLGLSALRPSLFHLAASFAFSLSVALTLAACGGAGASDGAKSPSEGEAGGAPRAAVTAAKMRGDLPGATVYDAQGAGRACEPPREPAQCPDAPNNLELRDKCRLAGFQTRRCGCEVFCAGNVAAKGSGMFYDASGAAKACEKEAESCSAPPPSAAFQDACNDRGHKLKVCGCEWLCSGRPTP